MRNRPATHHKPAPAIILLLLALIVAGGNPLARAEEPVESTEPPKSNSRIMSFLDTYHTYLEDKMLGPTIWFDNFFGDKRIEDDDPPSSFVRIRLAARYTESEEFKFPVRVRANLVLPKVNRRLRLIAFGVSRDEEFEPGPDDSIDSSLPAEENEDRTRLGLRYLVYKSMRDLFHFGGGVSVGWPMEAYLRMRYSRLMHLGQRNVIRFSETGVWNTLHGASETTRLDLERVLPANITGRLSVFASYLEDESGLHWGAETSFFRQLTTKSALTLDLGAYGVTRPDLISTYRVASRYRRNFLRPWLFFEIEPEVLFPLAEDNETRRTIGVFTTALECQFFTANKPGE
jgi:hypothetical protein